MAVNWLKIKNEYITTGISQRKLAEKYKVPYPTLRDKANKEKWAEGKKETRKKIVARTEQKTVEKIAEKESQNVVDGMELLGSMLNDILDLKKKVEGAIANLDMTAAEVTLIENTDKGRKIAKRESGTYKADKIVGMVGKMAKSVSDVVEIQRRYSDHTEEYEDDGLLTALAEALTDEEMQDDLAMIEELEADEE